MNIGEHELRVLEDYCLSHPSEWNRAFLEMIHAYRSQVALIKRLNRRVRNSRTAETHH